MFLSKAVLNCRSLKQSSKAVCLALTVVQLALSFAMPGAVQALPFNDDMVNSQIKTGQVMRPKVAGTVPLGSLNQSSVLTKEDAIKLENPVPTSADSVFVGKQLFRINCSPCHGKISKTSPELGKVQMGAPNLGDPMYHSRTDGQIYSTVHFGNIIMPALGWKLSPAETWDIINYVRSVQKE